MTPNIRSYEPIVPMIYAYSHPDCFRTRKEMTS